VLSLIFYTNLNRGFFYNYLPQAICNSSTKFSEEGEGKGEKYKEREKARGKGSRKKILACSLNLQECSMQF